MRLIAGHLEAGVEHAFETESAPDGADLPGLSEVTKERLDDVIPYLKSSTRNGHCSTISLSWVTAHFLPLEVIQSQVSRQEFGS